MRRPARSTVVLFPVVILALLLVALAASAYALRLQLGEIVIIADGGFKPGALPKKHDAPITLYGGGRLSTVSGELPPIIKTITIDFDRHGHVDTTGLPVCTRGKLENTLVAQARHNCPGAVVGKGWGRAVVKFPEQAPIPVSSPITVFNGPKVHGNDTVFGHAHINYPAPTTFVVQVVIERIHKGVYGYRTEATIPPIAGGYGVPLAGFLRIGCRWTYRGKRHSYVNARCETGHLQARGEFSFKDGTFLTGTFIKPCKVRG